MQSFNIPRRNGYDTEPKHGAGTWDEFLKWQGKTLWKTVAFVERFAQSISQEALDHFVVFGTQHMDVIRSEFVLQYLLERPHQGLDNELIQKPSPTNPLRLGMPAATICLGDVPCKERLGGLLKNYSRKAA